MIIFLLWGLAKTNFLNVIMIYLIILEYVESSSRSHTKRSLNVLFRCSDNHSSTKANRTYYLFFFSCRDKSDLEYFNDPRSYPLCCWMPFTVSDYSTFLIICTMQFLVILYTLIMYLINDTYMFGGLYIMGGQLDLIKMSLKSIARSVEHG